MAHMFHTSIQDEYIDSFGHVNNASYLSLLEEARWDWVGQSGMTRLKVQEDQFGTVILEMNLRFSRELLPKEKIRIETRVVEKKTKVYRVQQKIFNSRDELCTTALIVFGFFDLKRRKLAEPTEAWKKAISDSL